MNINEFVLVRDGHIDAPVARVWQALNDPVEGPYAARCGVAHRA